MSETEKFLRIAEIEAISGLNRSTLYRLIKAGNFPEPIHLSARSVAWKGSEIAAWVDIRAAKGREEWRANRPQAQALAKKRRAAVANNGRGGQ